MDLTDALGAPPLHMPTTTTMAAEVLDEVLARRAVPGRPADLERAMTWGSSGPPLGAGSTSIPAFHRGMTPATGRAPSRPVPRPLMCVLSWELSA